MDGLLWVVARTWNMTVCGLAHLSPRYTSRSWGHASLAKNKPEKHRHWSGPLHRSALRKQELDQYPVCSLRHTGILGGWSSFLMNPTGNHAWPLSQYSL